MVSVNVPSMELQMPPPLGATAALAAAYRRRLLQLAARDLTGVVTVDEVGEELADIAAAVLEAALAVARSELPSESMPCRLAVVAMGKCGARELNYASDVDVIFVAGAPDAAVNGAETAMLRTATALASGLIRVCSQRTPEGPLFPVDANLRPEGRDGPLVRTVASHLAYYQRLAKTWEFQALLKARFAVGDAELGGRRRFEALSLTGRQHHLGSVLGVAGGDGGADSARCAGHQRHPAGQVQAIS